MLVVQHLKEGGRAERDGDGHRGWSLILRCGVLPVPALANEKQFFYLYLEISHVAYCGGQLYRLAWAMNIAGLWLHLAERR
jgi:hypothetical protein